MQRWRQLCGVVPRRQVSPVPGHLRLAALKSQRTLAPSHTGPRGCPVRGHSRQVKPAIKASLQEFHRRHPVSRLHQTQPRLMQPRWSARMARLINWAATPALHLQKARRARPPQRCVCPIRAVGSTGCAPMGDGPMGFPVPASSFDRHCVDVHTTTQQLRSFPVHSPGWIIEHPGFLSHVQPEAPC